MQRYFNLTEYRGVIAGAHNLVIVKNSLLITHVHGVCLTCLDCKPLRETNVGVAQV